MQASLPLLAQYLQHYCCYQKYTDSFLYLVYMFFHTLAVQQQDVDKCTLPLSETPTAEITDHLALSGSIIAAVLSVTSHKQTIGIGEPLVQVIEAV
jgi:hypothetical protein